MNIYGIIILSVLLGEFLLNLIADLLNLKTLRLPLPGEFERLFDENSYQKSQSYTRAKILFGLVESTTSLIVTIAFWFGKGFQHLDDYVRGYNFGEIGTGMIYIAVMMLFRAVISLPFQIFSTFSIEAKFGFNRTGVKTFITDLIKGFFLAVIIGGPLLFVILIIFQYGGLYAWIYCWIILSTFVLIIQFIAPTWIMPLFNKFTSLEDGELKKTILDYSQSIKFPLKDVYVMDGSKRSSKSNAFFTGFGKNKRIVLFDTLIAKHTVQELIAILAHEVGHYKLKHIIHSIVITILHSGFMFLLLSIFIIDKNLFDTFYMNNISIYAGLIFFSMLFSPIEFFLGIILQWLSRRNEFQADHFAAETTGNCSAMVEALKKLSLDNLSHLTPHPFYIFLHYSHPPVLQRIEALKKFK
ncbi:MAG: M48 family metallopeptidase [Ignavibacteriales bacterium]|nr:M48 family metallopeptidase [Ignavibacteriales bacterium]